MQSEASEPQPEEQFASLSQQEHAAHFGMWLFLTSEVLLFGALFGLYTAYRIEYPQSFRVGTAHNNIWIGTGNTLVLITSSFFAAYAVHALQGGRRRISELCLLVTISLGALFMWLKLSEYAQHFHEGIYPGFYYHSAELPGKGSNAFFTMYFFMTGLHGLHVIGGMCALSVILLRMLRGRYGPERYVTLELAVLYWHLVDSIWIFLWPLFYLLS